MDREGSNNTIGCQPANQQSMKNNQLSMLQVEQKKRSECAEIRKLIPDRQSEAMAALMRAFSVSWGVG
jgi:hypothetical protein